MSFGDNMIVVAPALKVVTEGTSERVNKVVEVYKLLKILFLKQRTSFNLKLGKLIVYKIKSIH